MLDVDHKDVDLHRFRRLLRDANATDGALRATRLRDAVALWRGVPLGGIDAPWATRMRHSWTQERIGAVVAWADAELAVDNPAEVIGPLNELADEHPMTESVSAVLIRALHAVGRPADAIVHYTRLRARLSEELGVDPGPEIQALFQALLRGGPPAP